VRSHPTNEAGVEHVKTESSQSLDMDENMGHRLLLREEGEGYQSMQGINAL
jgi:hypothetical protein